MLGVMFDDLRNRVGQVVGWRRVVEMRKGELNNIAVRGVYFHHHGRWVGDQLLVFFWQ